MVLLIPAMAAVGGSGFAMGKGWRGTQIEAKRLRMKFIGGNGILILIPSAFFLASRAQAPNFDGWFYTVQTLEILAGVTNLFLLGLNMRDGIALARRRKKAAATGTGKGLLRLSVQPVTLAPCLPLNTNSTQRLSP